MGTYRTYVYILFIYLIIYYRKNEPTYIYAFLKIKYLYTNKTAVREQNTILKTIIQFKTKLNEE